jgi:hypothetical protein
MALPPSTWAMMPPGPECSSNSQLDGGTLLAFVKARMA